MARLTINILDVIERSCFWLKITHISIKLNTTPPKDVMVNVMEIGMIKELLR